MRALRLGTRGSDLALWQARHVAALLSPEVEVELVVLQTQGDRIDDRPLTQVEGKAFFTAEIERALLDGAVDLAVHSHKDLPTESPEGLVIAAVPRRGPALERLLVSPRAHAPDAPLLPLAHGATVGTSSPRREQQLRALRPDLRITSLRGNVPTRVARLREGRYDAILLAAAGLERLALDLAGLHVHDLPAELLVPAPAQGALAVQVRAGDIELQELCLRRLHDEETHARVEAERHLLALAGGGCNLPLGAFLERAGPEAAAASSGPWRARAFLGADHPHAGAAPRWAVGRGRTPEEAAHAVLAVLQSSKPTGTGPLSGLRVALAGSADETGASLLGERLAELGAQVTHEALIAFEDVPCPQFAERVRALRAGDVLALTSRQAALRLERLLAAEKQRVPEGVRVAAVGPSTARAFQTGGLRADVVGTDGARALAESLELAAGARVLFPCAEGARSDLADVLAARGAQLQALVVYRTRPAVPAPACTPCDVRVFGSPSAVEAAVHAWGLPACRGAGVGTEGAHATPGATEAWALGAATAQALAAHGIRASVPRPLAPASHPTPGSIVEATLAALVRRQAGAARSQTMGA